MGNSCICRLLLFTSADSDLVLMNRDMYSEKAPSSFLFLVVRPETPSVLAPSDDALCS